MNRKKRVDWGENNFLIHLILNRNSSYKFILNGICEVYKNKSLEYVQEGKRKKEKRKEWWWGENCLIKTQSKEKKDLIWIKVKGKEGT